MQFRFNKRVSLRVIKLGLRRTFDLKDDNYNRFSKLKNNHKSSGFNLAKVFLITLNLFKFPLKSLINT